MDAHTTPRRLCDEYGGACELLNESSRLPRAHEGGHVPPGPPPAPPLPHRRPEFAQQGAHLREGVDPGRLDLDGPRTRQRRGGRGTVPLPGRRPGSRFHVATRRRMRMSNGPRTRVSDTLSRPPGRRTRNASASTRGLSADRFMAPLERTTSTHSSGRGMWSIRALQELGVHDAELRLACARQNPASRQSPRARRPCRSDRPGWPRTARRCRLPIRGRAPSRRARGPPGPPDFRNRSTPPGPPARTSSGSAWGRVSAASCMASLPVWSPGGGAHSLCRVRRAGLPPVRCGRAHRTSNCSRIGCRAPVPRRAGIRAVQSGWTAPPANPLR